jgi:hypothetical protein
MTITPGNLSMLLAIASSVAPGVWAIVAGILGAFVGYFGKQILKKYDRSSRPDNSRDAGPLPRRNAARRATGASKRKADAASRKH